jgi:hypothetical protein
MNQQARMPWDFKRRVASRACAMVLPLSMASRIFWDPDSTPSHTSSHPACASAATAPDVMRFTRDWIENGVTAPRACTASAKASIHRGVSPKMSSANQTCSGPTWSRNARSSSATLVGLRCTYERPNIGLAHQLHP